MKVRGIESKDTVCGESSESRLRGVFEGDVSTGRFVESVLVRTAAPGPVRKLRWSEWLLLILAVLIALSAAAGIAALNARYASSLRAQLSLAQIGTQADRLSALSWQIAAQHTLPDDFDTTDTRALAALRSAFDGLPRLGLSPGLAGRVHAAADRYDRDVHYLFRLEVTLQDQAAQDWNVVHVDPDYNALRDELHHADAALQQQGQGLAEAVQLGVALALVASAIGMSVLFWRYQRARYANEALVVHATEQRARAEGEERFRSLVQNASDVTTILDGDGIIQYLTPSVARVIGYDPTALVGTRLMALLHPHDTPAALSILQTAMAQPTLDASND